MKKIIITSAFALLLCVNAQAQSCNTGQESSRPSPDAKLISTTTQDNCRVTTWLVKKSAPDNENNEFSVKYRVNISRLISSYDDNHTELVKLRSFMDGLMADGENEIVKIAITGYASPDGSHSLNERLAKERASDCCTYLKKNYSAISKTECTTAGVALPWSATESAVKSSSIPMKSNVLKIVESDMSDSSIESKLRDMTSAWNYMVSSILPPMRCVEIHVVYNTWERVVTRSPIGQQARENILIENNYYIFVDDDPRRLMAFENRVAPLDWRKSRRDCKKMCFKDYLKFREHRRRAKVKEDSRNEYGRQRYLWKVR